MIRIEKALAQKKAHKLAAELRDGGKHGAVVCKYAGPGKCHVYAEKAPGTTTAKATAKKSTAKTTATKKVAAAKKAPAKKATARKATTAKK